MKDEYVEVLIRKPSGEEWLLEIDKEYDDELGVEFENGLMSEYRPAVINVCSASSTRALRACVRLCILRMMTPVFHFAGKLYTMTNMKQADIDRIIHMQLAPINISVQTTNPELRCKMLHNRFAGEKLKFLQDLYEAHIEMNGQIVLCKGVNDKE